MIRTRVLCSHRALQMGLFGYPAFSSVHIDGDIMNNFPDTASFDMLKLGFAATVITSIPLIVYPCRMAINSMLTWQTSSEPTLENLIEETHMPRRRFVAITVTLVLLSLLVAVSVPSIEIVLAVNGATMGCLLAYIIPSVIYLRVSSRDSPNRGTAKMLLLVGVFIMCLSMLSHASTSSEAGALVDSGEDHRLQLLTDNVPAPVVNARDVGDVVDDFAGKPDMGMAVSHEEEFSDTGEDAATAPIRERREDIVEDAFDPAAGADGERRAVRSLPDEGISNSDSADDLGEDAAEMDRLLGRDLTSLESESGVRVGAAVDAAARTAADVDEDAGPDPGFPPAPAVSPQASKSMQEDSSDALVGAEELEQRAVPPVAQR